MPREIVMRHRLPHFGHLFRFLVRGRYYVYLWAEVLDADGHDAFVEAGDPFDAQTAARLRRYVYSTGATLDPAESFRGSAGATRAWGPMLAKRGSPRRSSRPERRGGASATRQSICASRLALPPAATVLTETVRSVSRRHTG